MLRPACAAALTLVALTAWAAPPVTGFYLGAGVGQSRYSIDFGSQVESAYGATAFAVIDAGMGSTHDTAYRVFGGYRFSPYVAVEGGWQDLGSATGNYTLRNTVNGDVFARSDKWELSGFNAMLVGMYPFAERFAVLGKVGAFFSKLEFTEVTASAGPQTTFTAPSDEQVLLMWGIGGSYSFTDNLLVRLDWDRIENVGTTFALTENGNGQFSHVDLWSVSMVWRF
jgi:OOP family OmpA-OmpF porin